MIKTNFPSKKFLRKHQYVLVCLCLVVFTFYAYWQVHNHDFLNFDDNKYVYDNQHIQSGFTLESALWAFTTNHVSNWHPLTWLSHMLDYQLYGMNPRGHHLTNLFFHIANSLLLFFVFRKMTGHLWRSAFVASLFALHPLHVESVAWVSERKDVLSTFFWMLTMWSYARYAEHPKVDRYLLVLLFFILGLMAKPMLVTLPFVLLLLDFYPLNRIQFHQSPTNNNSQRRSIVFRLVLEKMPLFVFVIISCAITFYAQKHGGAVVSLDAIPIKVRIANSLVSYVSYIIKMVWPTNMAVLYPYQTMIPGWKIVGAGVFLLSISIVVIISMKQRPYLSVGWFWYIGTLVPVIGLVQVGNQSMADRYTYIPLIGLFIITAWGISDIVKRWRFVKTILPAIAISILFIFMSATYLQVQYWKNSITLYEHALEVNSNSWLLHYNLGLSLKDQGRIDDTIKHFVEALRIKPDSEKAHYNLGLALKDQGRIDDAIRHYEEALRINPDHLKAHINLGVVLYKQGSIDKAIEHYLQAMRINPDYMETHYNLGMALAKQGRIDRAIEHYQQALRINPNFAKAHNNLGTAFYRKGNIERAIEHIRKAIKINPDYVRAKNNFKKILIRHPQIND